MKTSGRLSNVLIAASAGFVILMLAYLALTKIFIRTSGVDQAAQCQNNISLIDGAIMRWALEKNVAPGAAVTTNDILPYLEHGMPSCPIGGHYVLTKVGVPPVCSMPTNAHKVVY